ncbi:DUF4136 domain-containing protein [Robbsia sp. KACC 23696]|uniref:DUF4136 domain-containing protein n=1 Tax=Robbsia sp. KACC 23696 TaxID=3149231 RepID=UPI00325B55BF
MKEKTSSSVSGAGSIGAPARPTTRRAVWRRVAGAGVLTGVALLGGCASYVTSNVTAFQDWRGSDAQRTYAFQADPAHQNDLEQSTYQSLVAETLSTYGFSQVPRAQAHYAVSVAFAQRQTTGYAPQAIYPGGPFGFGYDPVWRGRRGWGPGAYWAAQPTIVNLPYAASASELTIRIAALPDGKEVYKVTARHVGDQTPLPVVMPYLVRSALFDFPMPNGTVRDVKLPADRRNPATNAGL